MSSEKTCRRCSSLSFVGFVKSGVVRDDLGRTVALYPDIETPVGPRWYE